MHAGLPAVVEEINPQLDTPLYEQVAAVLRAMIESGEIQPRYPIPPKRWARQRWGISGSTYDRATGILKDAGWIRTSPGRGLFVVAPEERGKG